MAERGGVHPLAHDAADPGAGIDGYQPQQRDPDRLDRHEPEFRQAHRHDDARQAEGDVDRLDETLGIEPEREQERQHRHHLRSGHAIDQPREKARDRRELPAQGIRHRPPWAKQRESPVADQDHAQYRPSNQAVDKIQHGEAQQQAGNGGEEHGPEAPDRLAEVSRLPHDDGIADQRGNDDQRHGGFQAQAKREDGQRGSREPEARRPFDEGGHEIGTGDDDNRLDTHTATRLKKGS